MRRTVIVIAIFAAAAVAVLRWGPLPGRSVGGRVSAAPVGSPSLADRFQARLLAERYGLPEASLVQARQEGMPAEDLALAANLSARSGVPFQAVLKERKGGEEWSAISRKHGVPEQDLLQPAAMPLPRDDEALVREMLQRRFQLTELMVARLRQEGFPAAEIVLAAELSGGGDSKVAEALYAHRQGQTWRAVAARFPARPVPQPGSVSVPTPAGQPGAGTPTAQQAARLNGVLAADPGHRPGTPEPERRGGSR